MNDDLFSFIKRDDDDILLFYQQLNTCTQWIYGNLPVLSVFLPFDNCAILCHFIVKEKQARL